MSNIAAQLRSLKNRPLAGGVAFGEHDHYKVLLLQNIGNDEVNLISNHRSTLTVQYGLWLSRSFISRPVVASVAGIMVVMSGLLTTVSAAEQSLPGDVLYTVKILNERTQLQLASLDRRAILHTEFAGRRLQEVAQLQKDETLNSDSALVTQTMDAYKNEITSANHNLQELQATGDVATVATANQVQQNLVALDSTMIETAAATTTVEQSTAVTDAQTTTQVAQENSVAVAVQAHQVANSEQSTRELNEMFMRQFNAIETRRAFDLHRIEIIRISLALHSDIFVETPALLNTEDLQRLERSINIAVADVAPAMDTFAAGNYRAAFEVLQHAEDILRGIEATLAEGEVSMTDILMNQQDTTEQSPEPIESSVIMEETSNSVINTEIVEPQE